ncbi:hypothetical protein ASG68_04820 [Rhizobium sp. Leaf453]|nr:hypothetical protein ASG42_12090 [Rhizobium sp. Leaf391]KQS94729.1 hypothetical protein ASG50_26040 [Rhizobium sp. Leaf386]KQU01107.1 hypothetical protein ASG68_04820 [Rhizobium sp. Leaf453]
MLEERGLLQDCIGQGSLLKPFFLRKITARRPDIHAILHRERSIGIRHDIKAGIIFHGAG